MVIYGLINHGHKTPKDRVREQLQGDFHSFMTKVFLGIGSSSHTAEKKHFQYMFMRGYASHIFAVTQYSHAHDSFHRPLKQGINT